MSVVSALAALKKHLDDGKISHEMFLDMVSATTASASSPSLSPVDNDNEAREFIRPKPRKRRQHSISIRGENTGALRSLSSTSSPTSASSSALGSRASSPAPSYPSSSVGLEDSSPEQILPSISLYSASVNQSCEEHSLAQKRLKFASFVAGSASQLQQNREESTHRSTPPRTANHRLSTVHLLKLKTTTVRVKPVVDYRKKVTDLMSIPLNITIMQLHQIVIERLINAINSNSKYEPYVTLVSTLTPAASTLMIAVTKSTKQTVRTTGTTGTSETSETTETMETTAMIGTPGTTATATSSRYQLKVPTAASPISTSTASLSNAKKQTETEPKRTWMVFTALFQSVKDMAEYNGEETVHIGVLPRVSNNTSSSIEVNDHETDRDAYNGDDCVIIPSETTDVR